MPEHHHFDETYFGEDYYDEARDDSLDGSDCGDDPYSKAIRLHEKRENNPITKQK